MRPGLELRRTGSERSCLTPRSLYSDRQLRDELPAPKPRPGTPRQKNPLSPKTLGSHGPLRSHGFLLSAVLCSPASCWGSLGAPRKQNNAPVTKVLCKTHRCWCDYSFRGGRIRLANTDRTPAIFIWGLSSVLSGSGCYLLGSCISNIIIFHTETLFVTTAMMAIIQFLIM